PRAYHASVAFYVGPLKVRLNAREPVVKLPIIANLPTADEPRWPGIKMRGHRRAQSSDKLRACKCSEARKAVTRGRGVIDSIVSAPSAACVETNIPTSPR